eukprot:CAMPEP_0180261186 /NCGR_PEP_ID=MMETSP0987-20121128/44012_1 /TAXON_ID=697907 /ORGANISM="non described non described, Strain CCMP2293" /LENGTH=143 /DNA_ID=CAMNT_0022231129 /DNA_START=167 /DNA_END=600 /DNA_ORIENTATION=+
MAECARCRSPPRTKPARLEDEKVGYEDVEPMRPGEVAVEPVNRAPDASTEVHRNDRQKRAQRIDELENVDEVACRFHSVNYELVLHERGCRPERSEQCRRLPAAEQSSVNSLAAPAPLVLRLEFFKVALLQPLVSAPHAPNLF